MSHRCYVGGSILISMIWSSSDLKL
uniref:Uncharacterized protein n=1 Tax=Arundo donax TaxID=35708 RepID=A0A0A9BFV1_ARUDO